MFRERIQEIVRYHKVLRIRARDLRAQSAEVRERSYLLREENANLKDVLAETMLYVWARRDAIAEDRLDAMASRAAAERLSLIG